MGNLQLKTCVFVMTMTVGAIAAHAAEPLSSAHRSAASASRTLDLKLAPLSRIFTPAQIDAVLSRAVAVELEHVEVEASRIGDLPLRDKSASGVETVFKTVVRTLAPSPVYAARVNYMPDVTDPYRPTPVSLSMYHASFPPPYSQR